MSRKVMTVRELMYKLSQLPMDLPVWVKAEAELPNGDQDTLHASVEGVKFVFGDKTGGHFSGPPFDHVVVFANGIPIKKKYLLAPASTSRYRGRISKTRTSHS